MNEAGLTNDEKRCLQMWFRQAIAHVEKEEALRAMESEAQAGDTKPGVHSTVAVRRTKRNRLSSLVKELV